MIEGRTRIPTTKQIINAEAQRADGEYEFARDIVQPVVGHPLDTFSRLRRLQKQRHMMASRIFVGSEISLANREFGAPGVAAHLEAAINGITTIYENPAVQKAAHTIQEDVFGNPYEFATEMARDRVSYMLTYAALTGNTTVVGEAIELMDNIIRHAKEPTVRTLVIFERQRLAHQHEPSDESFSSLTSAFEDATAASLAAQNKERAATIAARYILDAEKRGDEAAISRGLTVYDTAVPNIDLTNSILEREREEARVLKYRQRFWRISTLPGENYSYLALPSTATPEEV